MIINRDMLNAYHTELEKVLCTDLTENTRYKLPTRWLRLMEMVRTNFNVRLMNRSRRSDEDLVYLIFKHKLSARVMDLAVFMYGRPDTKL